MLHDSCLNTISQQGTVPDFCQPNDWRKRWALLAVKYFVRSSTPSGFYVTGRHLVGQVLSFTLFSCVRLLNKEHYDDELELVKPMKFCRQPVGRPTCSTTLCCI